jgi:hypothetical protein
MVTATWGSSQHLVWLPHGSLLRSVRLDRVDPTVGPPIAKRDFDAID